MSNADSGLNRFQRRFAIAFLPVMIALAGLLYISHRSVSDAVAAQAGLAHQIDVASGQRMASQRLAQQLTELSLRGPSERLFAEIGASRDLLRQNHRALTEGDPEGGIAPIATEQMAAIYTAPPFNVGARLDALLHAADMAIASGAPLPADKLTAALTLAKGPLLDGLNAVVQQLEAEALTEFERIAALQRLLILGQVLWITIASFIIVSVLSRRLRRAATALEKARKLLKHNLRHDVLTNLPNRLFLTEFLEMTLSHARRQKAQVGICKFDLLGFGLFNEVHGHDTGDKVLKRIADMTREEVRKGDLVARFGEDEFVIVSPSAISSDELVALTRRINARISQPFTVDEIRCDFKAVTAVVLADLGETDGARLLTDVDIALADAKGHGRPICRVYTPALRQAHDVREQLRRDIKAGLDGNQFEPFFQPQIEAKTGRIDGFEALARWRHPTRGLLEPAEFLYASVDFGLGDRLDETMMEKALDAMVFWRSQGLRVPKVGVNFSDAQLRDPFMAEKIKWAVDQRDLAPENICIEILETTLVEEAGEETARNIEGLARTGFSLDLDDFGTGHASIGTLQRFNVDRIKIDRSFVTLIDEDEEQQKVTSAMINLAHSLGAEALAEGVETMGEMSALKRMGCDYFQGYAIGRPMPREDVQEWIRGYEVGLNARKEEAEEAAV